MKTVLKPLPLLLAGFVFSAQADDIQTMQLVTVMGSSDGLAATVGGTKAPGSLLDAPQSVSVVTAENLRNRAALTSKDALDYVSSVVAGQGEGRRDEFYIRGFYSLRDTSLDGVRDDTLYSRDLATVEKIEVIKGAAAALYGRGSAGGLINRVSKQPRAQQETEVSATLGSDNERRVSVDAGGALGGGINGRLIAVYDTGDSYRDVVEHTRKLLAPSLKFALSPATTLLLQAEVQREDRTPDRGVPSLAGRPVAVSPSTYYGESYDYTSTDSDMAKAKLEHRFNDRLKLENTFQYSRTELEGVNTRNRRVNADNTVSRQITYFPQTQRNLINQTELAYTLDRHALLVGLELSDQKRDVITAQTGIAYPVSLYAPQHVLPAPNLGALPIALNNAFTAKTQALYLQDQITIAPQWKALAGVRYDRFQQEQTNRLSKVFSERTDNVVSPRAGLVYQPLDGQSWYLNLSRSSQPGGGDLLYTGSTPLSQVKPLQTDLQEVGYKQDWMGGRFYTTAALFRIEQRNQLTLDPTDAAGLRQLQVGKQRNQGVELELQGALWQGGRLNASYTYNDARVVASNDIPRGNRAEMTPRHRASLWVDQELGGAWNAGLGVLFSGSQFALSDNAVRLPGYGRVDAALGYRGKRYDVRFKLNNVGNARFYESAINNVQIQPGAPRNASVTLTSRF
ncbi:TonB-dependent receptor [Duganella violaceipulchra]|uniref:Catecholate siderophore receptor n=1 Tax=Duganella violaceipulchra TaxID=2849652 RepID=A0AA41H7I5_9BURK|nr:TonB-dependent siderophore receptor [Duganella violaceicalia]MBV6323512.1 TonB-dependent siderophore receptor [Duganella violaceicalia]MCP2008866.1 catecholate siderophore receptor [Duganella violaceicalia]